MLRIAALIVTIGAGIGAEWSVVSLNAQATAQAARQSVWEGLYSDAQAVRGRDAYTKACAPCHMDDLGGHEYAGALAGYAFQMKWEDASVAEVFGRIRTMPLGESGSLSTQEYLDILAYVLQANGYPSGRDELTIGIAAQRWPRIKIERVK
jgi:mono/diheme cytochrome c family protein